VSAPRASPVSRAPASRAQDRSVRAQAEAAPPRSSPFPGHGDSSAPSWPGLRPGEQPKRLQRSSRAPHMELKHNPHTQMPGGGFVYPSGRPRSSEVERRSAKPKVGGSIPSGANYSPFWAIGPQPSISLDCLLADRRVLYRFACGNELPRRPAVLQKIPVGLRLFEASLLQRTATCHPWFPHEPPPPSFATRERSCAAARAWSRLRAREVCAPKAPVVQRNAFSPVSACPTTSVCTSCVPS
jgi:hypothetical protein